MNKNLTYVIVIIIILAVVGGGIAYYLLYFNQDKRSATGEPGNGGDNRNPRAYFKANTTTAIVGHEISFDPNGSKDDDGYITTYIWDFGDGEIKQSSNSSVVNHTYLSPREYIVNLTVRDNDGATGSYSQKITVRPQDYDYSQTRILLKRLGISEENHTIPVDVFAISLWINITFIGAEMTFPLGEAGLEVTITNPNGEIIGTDNKTTSRFQQANMDFYYDSPTVLIPGDYEMLAVCTNGGLYLNYNIEVRY